MKRVDKENYFINKIANSYIGDDAAVVGEYIYSSDAFCEGSHFLRGWMNPYQIGRKAMLVNISDAIAMNAQALYSLVSISIPRDMSTDDIDQLIDGLTYTSQEYGCQIIGGDTVGSDRLNISITIISQSSNPLYRKGLQEGDLLAYTGELGGSKRDLEMLKSGLEIPQNSKFYEPKLRADFISKSRQYLNAGMDISDGLFCDTNKLLDINKYGLEILKDINDNIGFSGEEYEMLISFNENNKNRVEEIAKELNLKLNIFGRISDNSFKFNCQSHHF